MRRGNANVAVCIHCRLKKIRSRLSDPPCRALISIANFIFSHFFIPISRNVLRIIINQQIFYSIVLEALFFFSLELDAT